MKRSAGGFTSCFAECAKIAEAADAELKSQTPPRGGTSEWYHCPACPQQRKHRGEMRSHMLMCEHYRAFIVGCVCRADLLPKMSQQLS